MSLKRFIPPFFDKVSSISPTFSAHMALGLFRLPLSPKRSSDEIEFWKTGNELELESGRACKSWGDGANIIFLVHGWESRGATYHIFIQKFVDYGYKVIAWDGPAHGDTRQKQTDLLNFSRALAIDIKNLKIKPKAIIGHSFGGACLGVLNDFMPLPDKLIFIAAPSSLHTAFLRFKKMINLKEKSYSKFVALCEKRIGDSIDNLSLINRPIDELTSCLVIHDEDDKDITIEDFYHLETKWKKAQFFKTKGLGHKKIIKSELVAQRIIDFIG